MCITKYLQDLIPVSIIIIYVEDYLTIFNNNAMYIRIFMGLAITLLHSCRQGNSIIPYSCLLLFISKCL